MEFLITKDIKVSVEPKYLPKQSSPINDSYYFRYHICIENLGMYPVRLLKRKWTVYDTGYGITEVSGDGVIGLTPEIECGNQFTYFSNVHLHSGIGSMHGKYLLQNLETGENFEVEIPKFQLHSEVLCN